MYLHTDKKKFKTEYDVIGNIDYMAKEVAGGSDQNCDPNRAVLVWGHRD